MLKIVAPANVMIFMNIILPIAQYDYLEPYWTNMIIYVFGIDEEAQELVYFYGNDEVTD